ncbi:kinase-like domain-containing protein, partial [Glomus cerebriforme]
MKLYLKMNDSSNVISIYGITKDPDTNNFMMVIYYSNNGNLRQMLNREFNSLCWSSKFNILCHIASGLRSIHEKELTHQDFHSGNILPRTDQFTCITDLGLCKPVNEKSENNSKKVYGVLPYVAPEVLRGSKYTQASDIYSFGIVLYEVFNGFPPYFDMAHDEFLTIKICNGLRPSFNIKVPQLINELYKQCVDADSLKRPTADYLRKKL